jgi:DNA modification methylase
MIDLRLGDCLEVMKTIPDGSIDAIITDPPYGTTACKWDSVIDFELMWAQLNRIIKPNGAIVLFASEPFSSALRMSNIKNYKYDWIWEKPTATGHLNAKKQPMRAYENILVFYKSQPTYNPIKTKGHERKVSSADSKKNCIKTDVYGSHGLTSYDSTERYPRNVITFQTDKQKSKLHPTQKPIALMEYLIKTYTNENETVLDFTMGSGTTMLACKNTNRNGIGIEMDSSYYNIAVSRLEA